MPSPLCERVVNQALQLGRAVLKTISPNDVGLTGSHQCGYYLPKQAWKLFSPFPPTLGANNEHHVKVRWHDGRETDSVVKWYGKSTRSEYRLTRFGRGFPFLKEDYVGSLLVLIPERIDFFYCFVFDLEEDIEEIVSSLGIDFAKGWGSYEQGLAPQTEDQCLDQAFGLFVESISSFPSTSAMAEKTKQAVMTCVDGFLDAPVDTQLMRLIEGEYSLFKLVERAVCQPDVVRPFSSVDAFLKTAQSILQRRKARAGASLEHHAEFLLKGSGIPFELHPLVDKTEPDILVPSTSAYYDPHYPREKIFVLGLKTTCKDRWRQVIQEAPKVPQKYILTLQRGISSNQLAEMKRSLVSLVVPSELHESYPPARQADLFSVSDFFQLVKSRLAT